jgi:segregation and condensation protein A
MTSDAPSAASDAHSPHPAQGELPVSPEDMLLLRLDGFEGPLDLLLELARAQKLDLARISILALVEQYLAVIEGARKIRLELAADWLVMAAWLTWLKSRLLLPKGHEAAEEAETAAEILAERLRTLQAMRLAAAWLGARPQLGHDVFIRGLPEDLVDTDRSKLLLDIPGLLRAYLAAMRRAGARRRYRPQLLTVWTVKDALSRLALLVGNLPDWATLEQFLPEMTGTPLERRAALSSTLLAGLEMARGGAIRLRQEQEFGPIHIRRGDLPSAPADEPPANA